MIFLIMSLFLQLAKIEFLKELPISQKLGIEHYHFCMVNNNLYAVLDPRNFRVLLCDSNLNINKIFGSEGSGPGEFIKPAIIKSFNQLLIVYDLFKKHIFNLKGDYLYSFNNYFEIAFNFENEELFFYFIEKNDTSENRLNIKKISHNELQNGVELNEFKIQTKLDIESTDFVRRINDIIPLNSSGYLAIWNSEYLLSTIKNKHGMLTHYYRRFKRNKIKLLNEDDLYIAGDRSNFIEILNETNARRMKKTKGYEDDISHFVGFWKNQIVLKLSSNSTSEVRLDFISEDYKQYQTYIIDCHLKVKHVALYQSILNISTYQKDGVVKTLFFKIKEK